MVTMYPPQQVDAVLFDMDGTLLNTLSAWCVASEHLWGTSLADADSAKVDGGTVDDVVELYLRDHPQADPQATVCLLYTSPSPRDRQKSRMPSSA